MKILFFSFFSVCRFLVPQETMKEAVDMLPFSQHMVQPSDKLYDIYDHTRRW